MKVLVVQLRAIGDMILTTPMFRAIREKHPEASIDVLAGRHSYFVISSDPRLRNVFVYRKSPLAFLGTVAALRRDSYDYLIDPKDHHSTESALIARLTKARVKIGFQGPGRSVFDVGIPSAKSNYEHHFVQRLFHALEPIGIPMPEKPPRPELFTDPDSDAHVRGFLQRLNGKRLLVANISAKRADKRWVNESWRKVIDSVDKDRFDVVLSFAPPEAESAHYLGSRCEGLTLFDSRSIRDVVSLVQKADLLVTVDTALVHIAAAFNRPLVALFRASEAALHKFRPLSDENRVILAKPWDRGLGSIPHEEVIEAVDTMISRLFPD